MTDRVFLSTVSHRGSISGFIHRVSPIRYGSTMAKRLSFCAKALPSIGEVPQSRRYCHGTQIRFSSSVISLPKSRVLPRFAAICRAETVAEICDSVTEKAKCGKMRQVNAVNGSQMVVKLRGSYYRLVKGIKRNILIITQY